MTDLLTLIEDCFSFLNIFIFFFPILGLVYFLKDKKKERFILFIGLTLSTGGILFHKIVKSIDIDLNYFISNIFHDLLILVGYLLILIAFVKIVKNDLFDSNMVILLNNKKFRIIKTIYFSGLVLILMGFFVNLFYLILSVRVKPLIVLYNTGILFTIDSISILLGIIFCLFGILGTVLLKKSKGD